MNIPNLIKEAERSYSIEWEQSSKAYEENGYYDWCIDHVQECTGILEIGTGIGICTEKLITQGFQVTSVEEVPLNFQKSQYRLQKAGLDFNIINRKIGNKIKIGENNLVQSDFITDQSLHSDLISQINFDGVICWFVGSHTMTHEKADLRKLGYTERHPPTYRDFIYDKIFNETSKYLAKGGLINLVERTNILSDEDRIEQVKLFSDYYKLADFGLKVKSIDQTQIENIHNLPGINMTAYNNDEALTTAEAGNSFALTSTTIVKV